jgi:hypothetical protein
MIEQYAFPRIEVLGDRRYRYLERYPIEWIHEYQLHRLWIPEGFVLDGNSVPWFGRVLIPGDWTLGIIPISGHDLIYERKGRLLPGEHEIEVTPVYKRDALDIGHGLRACWTRRDADRWFARMMRDYENVRRWRRRAAYRAVRSAVWRNWDERPWRMDHGLEKVS